MGFREVFTVLTSLFRRCWIQCILGSSSRGFCEHEDVRRPQLAFAPPSQAETELIEIPCKLCRPSFSLEALKSAHSFCQVMTRRGICRTDAWTARTLKLCRGIAKFIFLSPPPFLDLQPPPGQQDGGAPPLDSAIENVAQVDVRLTLVDLQRVTNIFSLSSHSRTLPTPRLRYCLSLQLTPPCQTRSRTSPRWSRWSATPAQRSGRRKPTEGKE